MVEVKLSEKKQSERHETETTDTHTDRHGERNTADRQTGRMNESQTKKYVYIGKGEGSQNG